MKRTHMTSPMVTSVSPAADATGVALGASVVIDFSEPMDTGSVSVACSEVGGAEVALTPAWSDGDTRLTLTHADFAANTSYAATIDAAQDLAGNDLDTLPYTWAFTTGSGGEPTLERLIVFEAFLSPLCGYCQSAAPVIDDQLVPEYAGQPVLFLEHDVTSDTPREYRWWDGWQVGGYVGYPMAMVDSGDQVAERLTSGTDFYNIYKTMVDAALAVPEGQAEVQATVERLGDTVVFTIDVTNRGSVTLGSGNRAAVWVLVYEESSSGPVSGGLTQRYVRASVREDISSDLAPDASDTYVLTVDSLSGVDWGDMHAVVIVDYRPDPSSRPYDTYQAIAVDIP